MKYINRIDRWQCFLLTVTTQGHHPTHGLPRKPQYMFPPGPFLMLGHIFEQCHLYRRLIGILRLQGHRNLCKLQQKRSALDNIREKIGRDTLSSASCVQINPGHRRQTRHAPSGTPALALRSQFDGGHIGLRYAEPYHQSNHCTHYRIFNHPPTSTPHCSKQLQQVYLFFLVRIHNGSFLSHGCPLSEWLLDKDNDFTWDYTLSCFYEKPWHSISSFPDNPRSSAANLYPKSI